MLSCPAAKPVPDSDATVGEADPCTTIERFPLTVPAAVGSKATVIVELFPAASTKGRAMFVVILKTALDVVICVIVMLPPPADTVLLSVNVLALLLPIATDP